MWINEDVGGDINQLTFELPAVAPDKWFIQSAQVQITAFNAQGETIAGAGGASGASCALPAPVPNATQLPARRLPGTGTGAPQTTPSAHLVLGALFATATASVLVLAGMRTAHQRLHHRAASATRR